MADSPPQFDHLSIISPSHAPGVHMIRMEKPPENRLNVGFAQTLIAALRYIEHHLIGRGNAGAVIISSFSDKFWCTGLDLDEAAANPYANSDGFFPLLATLLDYPYPTIALITGHTFGGACPLALSHDYRIMNSKQGYFSMPPVNLGLHFPGIGTLPRLKLGPQVARKMLLEAHKWTSSEACKDGIVDEIVDPEKMEARAIEVAQQHAERARMDVYGLLRNELWGEAADKLRAISYVHRGRMGTAPRAKV